MTDTTESLNRMKIIAGIGEIVWDIFPDGQPRLGGAPANFVYYSQLLGTESLLISRIGDDELGKETLYLLAQADLNQEYIQIDPFHPTGTVRVSLDAAAVPTFFIEENVAWDYLEKSPNLRQLASKVNAICFGSLAFRSSQSRETLNWFLSGLRADCVRILDINLRPPFFSKDLIEYLFTQANVLKINETELGLIKSLFSFREREEKDILKKLLHLYNFKLIALTKGEKGSLLLSGNRECHHPGFPVKAIDTVGAGDAFTAALVNGLLKGMDLEEINRRANWLASYVCTQKGAWVKLENKILS